MWFSKKFSSLQREILKQKGTVKVAISQVKDLLNEPDLWIIVVDIENNEPICIATINPVASMLRLNKPFENITSQTTEYIGMPKNNQTDYSLALNQNIAQMSLHSNIIYQRLVKNETSFSVITSSPDVFVRTPQDFYLFLTKARAQ